MGEYDDKDFQIESLNDAIDALHDENIRLRDALAVNLIPDHIESQSAHTTILELRYELKTIKAELDAVKKSRDTFQKESHDKEKLIKWYKKRLENVGAS